MHWTIWWTKILEGKFIKKYFYILQLGGMQWYSLLRQCTTNQKVTGSIPDGVIGIFHWNNPSGHTMAMRLTQSLTEMCTRNISWGGKVVSAQGWQPYHPDLLTVSKSGSLYLLKPSGPFQTCMGIALPYPLPPPPFSFLLKLKFRNMYPTVWHYSTTLVLVIESLKIFTTAIEHILFFFIIWTFLPQNSTSPLLPLRELLSPYFLQDFTTALHFTDSLDCIFIVTPCMLSSYSIITPTTAHI